MLSENESVRLERIKNAPKITEIYKNNYFQPVTPNVTHRCYNANKIKSSPQSFLAKTSCICENEENLKVPDSNILDLLRESDKTHSKGDTQMLKPFHNCQRETVGNSPVIGLNSNHVNLKAPLNGITSDLFTRSSSGSDLTSPKHWVSRDTNGISNDMANESECLLIRHHSVGHRPKARYELTEGLRNNTLKKSNPKLNGQDEMSNTRV